MLRIGFNGTSVADSTDITKNLNGEDVNKGWHKITQDYKNGQQVNSALVSVWPLTCGGDYQSLDAMVSDLINDKIPVQYRNDPRLVVLASAELAAAEQFRLYRAAARPTEKIAVQLLSDSVAGCAAYVPLFMPGRRLVVTMLSNLHIYTQRNTRQRKAEFVEDRKQYENKYLRNEGYALEYSDLYAAFNENSVIIAAKPAEQPES